MKVPWQVRQANDVSPRVFNHLLSQTTGFRTFDKDGDKRADGLVACLVYATLGGPGDGRAGHWDKLKRAAPLL
jgi:hypothetical protein